MTVFLAVAETCYGLEEFYGTTNGSPELAAAKLAELIWGTVAVKVVSAIPIKEARGHAGNR
jgi:hypothetical protein